MFVISFIPLGYIRKTIRKISEVNVFSILSFFRERASNCRTQQIFTLRKLNVIKKQHILHIFTLGLHVNIKKNGKAWIVSAAMKGSNLNLT